MRVLIVDPNAKAQNQLSHWLINLGYDPIRASDADEAWERLSEVNAPRLVVINWKLAGRIDAIGLCKRIKNDNDRPYTYVIYLDEEQDQKSFCKGLDNGADDFISKDMDPLYLKSRFSVASRILGVIPLDIWLMPKVAGYQVNYLLGKGAMGSVWHAIQEATGMEVALKLIRLDLVTAQYRKRFKREIVVAANINHPYIAKIYDSGQVGQIFYYAMELIDGGELHQSSKQYDQNQLVEIVYKVCCGLESAHESGVIHRDLKPANIMILPNGDPKIVDFGVAKTTLFLDDPEDGWETQEGMAVGTPLYMAPEQAKGNNDELGPAADVYALGTMLYVLLLNRHPHKLTSYNRRDVLDSIVNTKVRPPSEVNEDFDKDLEFIIMRALAYEANDRYASAGDMKYDLEEYLEDIGISVDVPVE